MQYTLGSTDWAVLIFDPGCLKDLVDLHGLHARTAAPILDVALQSDITFALDFRRTELEAHLNGYDANREIR